MLDTFSDLRQAVRDWSTHRSVSDTKAAEFIRAAERRAGRLLRVEELEVTTQDFNGSVNPKDFYIEPGADVATLPADFLDLKDIWCYWALENAAPPPTYTYGTVLPSVRRISWEVMNSRRSTPAVASMYPTHFARNNRELVFSPVLTRFFVRMTYYAQPAFLSDSNPTNALLSMSPDLLLYGALAEAAMYVKLPQEAATFDARFSSEAQVIQQRSSRAELSGGSVVQRSVYYG
jgi:hypothetical protein